jgi:hypothetical protein
VLVGQGPYEGCAAAWAKKLVGWLGFRVTLVAESRGDFEDLLFARHPLLLSRFDRFLMRHGAKFTLDRAVVLWTVSHSARAQVGRDGSSANYEATGCIGLRSNYPGEASSWR